MTCNRCTKDFDHHCSITNNCVGLCNYKDFFILISCVQVSLTICIISCVYAVVIYTENREEFGNRLSVYRNTTVAIVLVCITLGICFIVFIMNGFLIGFHLYIKKKNLTTYEFISRRNRVVPEGQANRSFKGDSGYNLAGFDSVLSE